VHAGTISVITEKFKAMFASDKVENDETLATSQTMAVFKPVIVDGTTTSGADTDQDPEKDSLQAVSGPLRVSTEDIDFPTSDTISVYEVKKGDTIQDVAKLFDISVNTIMWANNLKSRTITKGDTLLILPITGIKHTVRKGDTITSIAKRYKADDQDVANYNGLSVSSLLAVGDTVIVPDGEIEAIQSTKPRTTTKKPRILNSYSYSAPTGFLIRPISGGRKSQGIHGHNGVDLAASIGTPVYAAADGRVIVAKMGGYNGGYGNMIIITHDKGIQTVYGHLNSIYITTGQTVTQGQTIGELGNTGKSTGPHLHFEVRGAKNPF
jgi:murein DD-endopeptidase MepM/ murein hydrolase activator NlpD